MSAMSASHRALAALSLGLLALGACSSTQKSKVDEVDVQVTVERLLPRAESLDASAIEVTLKVNNPTGKPIKIDSIQYEIDTKEVSGVLTGTSQSGATIESVQTALVTFSKSVPFPKDKEAYQEVISRGTITADLNGDVLLGDGRKLHFARKGQVATPTLPKFVVFDAQAARYEKEGLDVTLFLRLINENVFPITIERVRYTVFVDNKKIKSEQAAIGVRLLQGAAEEYEVSTILDDKTLEKGAVKRILASGKLGYKVTGAVDITRLQIPFEYENEIELGRRD